MAQKQKGVADAVIKAERRASWLLTGPRLMSGRQALTTWVGAVAGLTLHAAHLSTFDE
jgi:hypothetical protein